MLQKRKFVVFVVFFFVYFFLCSYVSFHDLVFFNAGIDRWTTLFLSLFFLGWMVLFCFNHGEETGISL
jgi:hypothetical protein